MAELRFPEPPLSDGVVALRPWEPGDLDFVVHVAHQHSGVSKGLVLGVKGGAHAYPYHKRVTLVVSSGPKKKKPKRH